MEYEVRGHHLDSLRDHLKERGGKVSHVKEQLDSFLSLPPQTSIHITDRPDVFCRKPCFYFDPKTETCTRENSSDPFLRFAMMIIKSLSEADRKTALNYKLPVGTKMSLSELIKTLNGK